MITLFKNRELDLFDYFFEPYRFDTSSSLPKIKIDQKDDVYELLMSVPGLSKDDLKITTDNREIKISYEKEENNENSYFVKTFSKSYNIPDDVKESDIVAKVENGVLKLTLPINKKKMTQRMIEIE